MTDQIKAAEARYEKAVREFELDTHSDEKGRELVEAQSHLEAVSPKAAETFASIREASENHLKAMREKQAKINEIIPSIQMVKVITTSGDDPWCLGVSYRGRPFYLSAVVDVRTQSVVSQKHYMETKLPDGVSVTWVDHCGHEKRAELEAQFLSENSFYSREA